MKAWMSARRAMLGSCAVAVLSVALTGCGGGDSGSGSGSSEGGGTTETQTSSTAPRELSGTWLGVAYLDDELLNKKRALIEDEETLLRFNALVATFESMYVGADFAADGTFSIEAEVTPAGGETIVQASAGRWTIETRSGDVLVVGWEEVKQDGSLESESKEYMFLDANRFVWRPNVSPDLQECEAMIVFERKALTAGEAEVATQPDTNEVR